MAFPLERSFGPFFCNRLDVPYVQHPLHRHHGHDIIVVTHGSCRVLIEETTSYTLLPDSILIVPGGNFHRRIVDTETCCCGIELSPDYFLHYTDVPAVAPLAQAFARRVCQVRGEDVIGITSEPLPVHFLNDHRAYRSFLNLFEECLAAYAQVTPMRQQYIDAFGTHFALMLLNLVQQAPSQEGPTSTTQRMLEIKHWLDQHFIEDVSIPLLARKANLSPHWFSTAFRSTVGVPPKTYLLTLRLKHAANLLIETDYSITSIASRVGYNDLANFIRAFTVRHGLTPKAYRRKYQHSDHVDDRLFPSP